MPLEPVLTLASHSLAYAEMRCILAKTLFNFDIEPVDEKKNWFDQKVFTLWEKSPLMVRLKEVRG